MIVNQVDYNKLEKEINDILNASLINNHDHLLDMLNQRYEETKYPGFIYAIGLLYEKSILYSNKPNKYYLYYVDAASQNYLPAIIKILELYLYHVYDETVINGVSLYIEENYKNIVNDSYGEYLLAKYGMIRSIVMNDEHEDFNDALVLMKDSANKGCLDAKEFLKKTKLENKNKLDILKIAAY